MNIILQKTKRTGMGETYNLILYANNLARLHNLDFDENNIVYNAKDLLKIIKEKKDSIIIFDEALI